MKLLKYSHIYLTVAIGTVLAVITAIAFFGFNLSIDFLGGSVLKYRVSDVSLIDDAEGLLRTAFKDNNVGVLKVEQENDTLTFRTLPVNPDTNVKIKDDVAFLERTEGLNTGIEQTSTETVGSSIGVETIKKTITAFATAVVALAIYITVIFRKLPKPYSGVKFATAALIALFHDVIVMLGTFSLLGKFINVEIDILFIAAVLTVLGFSVSDTLVVFDRIRENIKKYKKKSFTEIAGISLNESVKRSVSISLMLLIILVSLLLFGGAGIRYFVLALAVGVSVGAYSSIFVATPLLVVWYDTNSGKNNKKRK